MHRNYAVLPADVFPSKRDVLYFDKLILLANPFFSRSLDSGDEGEATLAYLESVGLLEQVSCDYEKLELLAKTRGLETKTFNEEIRSLQSYQTSPITPRGVPRPHPDSRQLVIWQKKRQRHVDRRMRSIETRLFAFSRTTEDETYSPLLVGKPFNWETGARFDVIEVILNEFPTPDDNVPYEEILAFKADKSVQRDFELFRRWMRKKVRDESASLRDVREELADLLSDYREHMELAKMKYHLGVVRTVLTAPLAMVERVVKFQFSKIFDTFFDLRASKIGLAESEIKAPGREVAYIRKAIDRFSSV